MSSSSSLEGRQWTELADLDESEREAVMEARYKELADLPEEERKSFLAAMEAAVYDLPDERIRSFTISRLRVWLNMDHDTAQMISGSFDTMVDDMRGSIAMRHVAMVQTMAREFSPQDQARLHDLFPRIFGAVRRTAPAPALTVATKNPWWAFWRT